MSEKPLDTNELIYPKTAEQASQNFEEHLRLTCPNWNEKQIIVALDDHRVKNLGLPPLAEANLTQEIRDWISLQKGEFQTRDLFEELNIPKAKKAQVSKILTRLIPEGFIERTGRRTGYFRRVEKELNAIDFLNSDTKSVKITFPFDIHKMVEVMNNDIVILAGAPNTGKSAFNVIADNMDQWEVHYFNSEMGAGELKKRLLKFEDIPLQDWNFKAWQRYDNFQDVIMPGEGKLNIVDYLEIYENFYEIGRKISDIHRKLQGAIALILIQKNPGLDYGLGGYRTLEKPRLALAMDKGQLKIVKAKNWTGKRNPNNKIIKFKLIGGAKFIRQDDWGSE